MCNLIASIAFHTKLKTQPTYLYPLPAVYSFIRSVILLNNCNVTGMVLEWRCRKLERQCFCSHADYLSKDEWLRPNKVIDV